MLRSSRRLALCIAGLATAAVAVACSGDGASPTDPVGTGNESDTGSRPTGPAATVNGQEIPRSAIDDLLEDENLVDDPSGLERQLLGMLIQDVIITTVTADADIEIDAADVAAAREELIQDIGGEEALPATLAQAGLTSAAFEDLLVPQQARMWKLTEQLAQGQSLETRTIRHIMVESEEEAYDLLDLLADGSDFAALAQEHSIDTDSGVMGGELPPLPPNSLPEPMDRAVWEADLNSVEGPIDSGVGVHLFEVIAQDTTPAEELDMAELSELVGAEIGAIMNAAFDDAEIEVNAAYGRWDPAQFAVIAADDPPPGDGSELDPEQLEELQRQLEELMNQESGPPSDQDATEQP